MTGMYTLSFFPTSRQVKFGSHGIPIPRGKLIHPSQGRELESVGQITDQTENSISSKKCEKVLYVTVIYTTMEPRIKT